MMFLFPHRNGSSVCLSTLRTTRACLAVFGRKLDLDHLIVASIEIGRPARAFMPGRTRGLLCSPIELNTTGIKALFCLAPCCQPWLERLNQFHSPTGLRRSVLTRHSSCRSNALWGAIACLVTPDE